MKLYVIVQTNRSDYNEQQMITRNSDREVIGYAGVLATRGGMEDEIVIDRIFSIDEYGNTEHHHVEFLNGKLVLTKLPAQS